MEFIINNELFRKVTHCEVELQHSLSCTHNIFVRLDHYEIKYFHIYNQYETTIHT